MKGSVVLDNSQKKPLIRMYLKSEDNKLMVIDGQKQEKATVNTVDDIYKHNSKRVLRAGGSAGGSWAKPIERSGDEPL